MNVTVDSIAFLLQVVGAALIGTAHNEASQKVGNHVALVGSILQITGFLAFAVMVVDFGMKIVQHQRQEKEQCNLVQRSPPIETLSAKDLYMDLFLAGK